MEHKPSKHDNPLEKPNHDQGFKDDKPMLNATKIHRNEEEQYDEDDELIAQLLEGFDQMDQVIQQPVPPQMHEMEEFVLEHQQAVRHKNRLELLLFLVVALLILSGYVLLAGMNLVVFIIIQVFAVLVTVGYGIQSYRRSTKKKVSEAHE